MTQIMKDYEKSLDEKEIAINWGIGWASQVEVKICAKCFWKLEMLYCPKFDCRESKDKIAIIRQYGFCERWLSE